MSDELQVQVSGLTKDPNLIAVLKRLCGSWGDRAFDVVDHWEANFHGVGVAKKENHSVLVYIDTFGKTPDTYYVELESPPEADSGQPLKSAGVFDPVNFDELSSLVGRHLGLQH
jgi:hypothetical protein